MEIIRKTRSVCPVCKSPLSALLVRRKGAVYLEKRCERHGSFSVPVWRDNIDIDAWRGTLPELTDESCAPTRCADCKSHPQGTCCALLEVTRRCNLRCRFCFAEGELPEPTLDELKAAVRDIFIKGEAPLLQLSGGEPTLRSDLPELVAYAKKVGFKYIQLNSNGLRLARDEDYLRALSAAGLSFVFMQFDGIDDEVYRFLRGAELLAEKCRAIDMCKKRRLGVTLVPTVVRGVNDAQIGDIVRFAAARSPVVRGVHFQPVSYFGRYPDAPGNDERYTLDELAAALCSQTEISPKNISPSHCDHPMCGFHGSFIALPGGELMPLTQAQGSAQTTTARQNREYIGRRWLRKDENSSCNYESNENSSCCCNNAQVCDTDNNSSCDCANDNNYSCDCANDNVSSCCCADKDTYLMEHDVTSMDGFLRLARERAFTVTAMAFQDAMNIDLERLSRCSLHVYENGALIPFCARYLTAVEP